MIIKNNTLVRIEKKDIRINGICTLPEGLTSIGNFAFHGCTKLKKIIIPESVTDIGWSAFRECTKLKKIIIPESVTFIGSFAFYGCEKLESLQIPDSVTYIGESTFNSCETLESIEIPESVNYIGHYAFHNCKNLTQIQWGNAVYPVKCIDYFCMNILHEKKFGSYTIYKCQYFPKIDNIVWVAEKDGITAHGASIKEAIRDVEFKLLENRNISEHIARIKSQGYVTPMDYRLITGACEAGTNKFLQRKHLSWDDKRSIKEVIELTKDEYGHEAFVKAMKDYDCMS